MLETYRGIAYPYQIDHIGHMNVQWYTAKFDEATWNLFSKIGITATYIRKNNMGMAAVEQVIKYKDEVLPGDTLVIRSMVLEMKKKSIRFFHMMYNAEDDRKLSSCEMTGVHIDRAKRKSCPFPGKIFQKGIKLIGNR